MTRNDLLTNDVLNGHMPTWEVLTIDVGRFDWWDVLTHGDVLTNNTNTDRLEVSNFPPSAAELFRLPPHRSGTHYQTLSFWHQHCGGSSTN